MEKRVSELQRATSGLLAIDGNGFIVRYEANAELLFGAGAVDALDRPIAELFDPEYAAAVHQMLRSGWLGVVEREYRTRAGRMVALDVRTDDDGGWLVIARDRTVASVVDQAEEERRRVEAIAAFADAIARELNDSMSVVQGRLELLLELGLADVPASALERQLRTAVEHARRMSATLRNLRLVGRAPKPELEPVMLADALHASVEMGGPRMRRVPVKIDLEPAGLTAGGDPALVGRVLGNLFGHLLDHREEGATIQVTGRAGKDDVELMLYCGAGEASELERVPEVSGAALDSLALRIATTLLESMGGELTSREGPRSTSLVVRLPEPPRRRGRKRATIERLLVVGDASLVSAFDGLIARDGYEVVSAQGAAEAIELLTAETEVDAMATELLLAGTSGLSLASEALRLRPELAGRVVVVTHSDLRTLPPDVTILRTPLRRMRILEALGRRVAAR